jgi:hypothetical protein
MLICYLDDSGTHDACPVITMAGYVGLAPQWAIFEQAVDSIYHYQIRVFHATEFHETKGEFSGWPRIRKQSYAQNIYDAALDARALDIGIIFSVRKDAYA